MHLKLTTLSLTCALALAACGGDNNGQQDRTAATTPAPATAPATDTGTDANTGLERGDGMGTGTGMSTSQDPAATAGADTASPASNKPEATVSNCATTIQGDDAMQFSVGSITVPSSCSEFTINLEHTGQLPVAAMGHNVVISQASDRQGIATDGMAAGLDGGYVPEGDDRVIAATELIGGGQTTSVTFPVSALQGGGPYEFFCSFPGHWAVMRGSIQVG
ncbi:MULTISPECIES: azurin [unclassified Luteimonas]|uniref:azurin n=1 Tax=Lysobacteraceae TaxID=32033 RepID=UPI001E4E639F|nr:MULTISPECIES: azurin [unclassified Luteimonas]MCD9045548.1 azurin [Luteimonas sp. MHLX1A]